MEAKKISEVENPLYSRKEYVVEIKANSIPSYDEVKKLLDEKFSMKPELVRINSVKGKFGTQVFEANVDVYSSDAEFKRVVKKTKQEIEKEKKAIEEKKKAEAEKKKAAEEAKKAEEEAKKKAEEEAKAAQEKPAETPAEETTNKEEEKTE